MMTYKEQKQARKELKEREREKTDEYWKDSNVWDVIVHLVLRRDYRPEEQFVRGLCFLVLLMSILPLIDIIWFSIVPFLSHGPPSESTGYIFVYSFLIFFASAMLQVIRRIR